MERLFGLEAARQSRAPDAARVATVGFFDGVHLGHRRLLEDLRGWAADGGAETAVVTFDRHPQAILGGHPPLPVVRLEHRLLLLERAGVDVCLVLEFDERLLRWSPEEFVGRVLHQALGAPRLQLGYDSAFGFRRVGTYEYLHARQRELGLEVRRSPAFFLGEDRISSTAVRAAIADWDLARLEALLGRRFSLLGPVVHGDGRGRRIGFPTANIDPGPASIPPTGVYFAEVRRLGARPDEPSGTATRDALPAVVNVGQRPTFAARRPTDGFDPERDRVEVHLLDFEGDLYGEWLEVVVIGRHRDERRFDSIDALVDAIRSDVAARRGLPDSRAATGPLTEGP